MLKGLNSPNGVAFNKGTLYVAERHRITRYDGIEDRLDNPPEAEGRDRQPRSRRSQPGHFWKFLAIGPDGKLYFNVGAPGNIVMPSYMQATINRVDPKTGVMEIYASGVRNSVGFDWDPRTKEFWFTNHARDWVSDDLPNDTLHRVVEEGRCNFGYPFCHQGDTARPRVRQGPLVQRVRRARRQARRAHRAARHALLHRQDVPGRVPQQHLHRHARLVEPHDQAGLQRHARDASTPSGKVELKPFLEGFLTDAKADPPMWGRPVDVLVMRDGALLVSDDYNGIVYRVSYGEVSVDDVARRARGAAAIVAARARLAGVAPAFAAGTDAQRQKAAPCEACHGAEGRSTNARHAVARRPAEAVHHHAAGDVPRGQPQERRR